MPAIIMSISIPEDLHARLKQELGSEPWVRFSPFVVDVIRRGLACPVECPHCGEKLGKE